MTIEIKSKIKSIGIVKKHDGEGNKPKEILKRPNNLFGTTYKLKSPLTEHALYITINDVIINEKKLPFEIFINSKSLENQQWIISLTRLISAIFRQHVSYNIDIQFIVEELKSVFDPNGGYLLKNKKIPSLVAEIGNIIEEHLITNKVISVEKFDISDDVKKKIETDKDKQFKYCPNCSSFSMLKLDGCDTCVSCGYSKC